MAANYKPSEIAAAIGDLVVTNPINIKSLSVTANGTYTAPENAAYNPVKVDVPTGSDTSDATAGAGDILSGKTAYVSGGKVTGTISSKAAQTYTPGTAAQTIAAGQYLSGVQTISGDANLAAKNIKSGVSIFGVTGTYGFESYDGSVEVVT